MAENLGLTKSAYSNYENGIRLPDVYAMVALLELYGIGPDWIYAGQIRGVPYDLAARLIDEAAREGIWDGFTPTRDAQAPNATAPPISLVAA